MIILVDSYCNNFWLCDQKKDFILLYRLCVENSIDIIFWMCQSTCSIYMWVEKKCYAYFKIFHSIYYLFLTLYSFTYFYFKYNIIFIIKWYFLRTYTKKISVHIRKTFFKILRSSFIFPKTNTTIFVIDIWRLKNTCTYSNCSPNCEIFLYSL